MNIITPTIGRKVWFWPNGSHIGVPAQAQPQCQDPAQAMDATIVLVHGDRMVNLLVLDHAGITWPVLSVTLLQEGDLMGQQGMYAQWMPYQVKQAAKEEKYTGPDFIGDDVLMVGDVVQFKSGGPLMTVEALHPSEFGSHKGGVTCAWQIEHNGQVLRETFQSEMLGNISGDEYMDDLAGLQPLSAAYPNHASEVLYPAILAAMEELSSLPPGFSINADRAFNYLHNAFWSEVPVPVNEPGLRLEVVLKDGSEEPAEDLPARTGLTFGQAIEALKDHERVARTGWNGRAMWLYFNDYEEDTAHLIYGKDGLEYAPEALPWIGMRTADNKYVPWLASQTDVLAEDYYVVG